MCHMLLCYQRHCGAQEASVQSADPGHCQQILPASVQLPDQSRRTLSAVQLV